MPINFYSQLFFLSSREKSFNRQQIFEVGENSHKKALQTFTLEHSRRDICWGLEEVSSCLQSQPKDISFHQPPSTRLQKIRFKTEFFSLKINLLFLCALCKAGFLSNARLIKCFIESFTALVWEMKEGSETLLDGNKLGNHFMRNPIWL